MIPSPFAITRTAIGNGDAEFQNLKRAITDFENKACTVITKDNIAIGERLYCLAETRQPPDSIAIEVARVLKDWRSWLDHIMFEMVRMHNPAGLPVREESIFFPCVQRQAQFNRATMINDWSIPVSTVDWLESLQMYSTGHPEQRPLIVFNGLCKITKHRYYTTLNSTLPWARKGIGGIVHIVSAESFNPEFVDDAVLMRVIYGKMLYNDWEWVGPLPPDVAVLPESERRPALAKHCQAILDADPEWTQPEWDLAMVRSYTKIEPTVQILFGPGSGIVEHRPVLQTLQSIWTYLNEEVFKHPVVQSL